MLSPTPTVCYVTGSVLIIQNYACGKRVGVGVCVPGVTPTDRQGRARAHPTGSQIYSGN